MKRVTTENRLLALSLAATAIFAVAWTVSTAAAEEHHHEDKR